MPRASRLAQKGKTPLNHFPDTNGDANLETTSQVFETHYNITFLCLCMLILRDIYNPSH